MSIISRLWVSKTFRIWKALWITFELSERCCINNVCNNICNILDISIFPPFGHHVFTFNDLTIIISALFLMKTLCDLWVNARWWKQSCVCLFVCCFVQLHCWQEVVQLKRETRLQQREVLRWEPDKHPSADLRMFPTRGGEKPAARVYMHQKYMSLELSFAVCFSSSLQPWLSSYYYYIFMYWWYMMNTGT